MKEGWIKIFSSIELLEVKLAENILKQHNIVSHIVQQPDSVFQAMGDITLYTPPENAEAAIKILQEKNIKQDAV